MFKKFFLSVVTCFFSIQAMNAQDWPASEKANYHSSIVKIMGDGISGSGTVIGRIGDSDTEGYYIGWILTASHCINSTNTKFTILFPNGKIVSNGQVALKSMSNDVYADYGIVRSLIPEDIEPMEISIDDVPIGETVEMCGYGTGTFRHWKAKYAGENMESGGHVVFSWAIQGDSGGPIIYNGKVIGVICFGVGIRKFKDTNRIIVGPIYGTNVDRVDEKIENKCIPKI